MTNRITTRRFVAVVKQKTRIQPRELYVFLFDDTEEDHVAIRRVFGRFASDLDLSFTWYDAAKLSCEIRRIDE